MSIPILKIIKPGLQTTIQDLGRYGYQQYGISPSGAMDTYSLQMANILTGNSLGEAVLEVSLIGPSLEALSDTVIAICGGDFSPEVDGQAIPTWKSFLLRTGQVLTLGSASEGARAYISVAGGIDVPFILHSKSTYLNAAFGGLEGRALEKGDILLGRPFIKKPLKRLHPTLIPKYENHVKVRVILGPHRHLFKQDSVESFLTEEFTITPQSNRMGYQLKGPKLEHLNGPDIISDPVPFGGIQVPASGQPIVLMADRQTTGGYSRMATVISVDIPLLAQAKPGTSVKFNEISIQKAQSEFLLRRKCLKHLALTSM
jgi:antagonist of KipI